MTKYVDDFATRLLYTQKCVSEDGPYVSSSIYAIKWTYPNASQQTTGRIRITCVYNETMSFSTVGGTIERWTDKGWLLIDEYCDENHMLLSELEFRERLLKMAHAFIMGIPINFVTNIKKSMLSVPNIKTIPRSKTKKIPTTNIAATSKVKKFASKEDDNYNHTNSRPVDVSKKDDDKDNDDDSEDFFL